MSPTPDIQLERVRAAAKYLSDLAIDIERDIVILSKSDTKLAEAASYFFNLKEAHTALESARKEIGKHVEFLNKSLIPSKLEHAGLDKIQVPELARSFYILTKTSCSMLDKEKGMEWLRDRGDGVLIAETVNAGTLAAYMTSLVTDEGIDPPEDIFKLSTYRTTGISKYQPK